MCDIEDMTKGDKQALLIHFYEYDRDFIEDLVEDELDVIIQEKIDEFDFSSIDLDDYDEDASFYDILMEEEDKQDLSIMYPNADEDEIEEKLLNLLNK